MTKRRLDIDTCDTELNTKLNTIKKTKTCIFSELNKIYKIYKKSLKYNLKKGQLHYEVRDALLDLQLKYQNTAIWHCWDIINNIDDNIDDNINRIINIHVSSDLVITNEVILYALKKNRYDLVKKRVQDWDIDMNKVLSYVADHMSIQEKNEIIDDMLTFKNPDKYFRWDFRDNQDYFRSVLLKMVGL